MKRKFMIYQRRDGFQIAEEANGTRLESGMEFLARPNKSDSWYTAGFNIVIDDDYELVGEDFIDCFCPPLNVLLFVDGVMKVVYQSRIALEDMIEQYDEAISDRDLIVARQLKADITSEIEACHTEASIINDALDETYPLARKVLLWSYIDGEAKARTLELTHIEALEMDQKYQAAISTIADNLTLPVWDGCSDTVKAEVIKHNHAEALAIEAAKSGN